VTWAVGAPGKLLGLGGVRAMCATQAVWAFASVLPPDTLGAVLTEVGAGDSAPSTPFGDELAAKLICDDLLDVTVVHIEADTAIPPTRAMVRTLDEVRGGCWPRSARPRSWAPSRLSCSTGSRRWCGR
jgi:hypothetical protein